MFGRMQFEDQGQYNPDQPKDILTLLFRLARWLLGWALDSMAYSLKLILHHSWGRKALNEWALGAMMLTATAVVTLASPVNFFVYDSTGVRHLVKTADGELIVQEVTARETGLYLWLFLGLAVAFHVCHRVTAGVRFMRGGFVHPDFDGDSYLHRLIPGVGRLTMKKWIEPGLVMLAAGFIGFVNLPLGLWLLLGGGWMAVQIGNDQMRLKEQGEALLGAQVEQEVMLGMRDFVEGSPPSGKQQKPARAAMPGGGNPDAPDVLAHVPPELKKMMGGE